jgi:hypothetical protein
MPGHGGHLIDILVLVLHGCAHGRVSHDVHDREQVFGRPIHLSSKAMARAVEDEVIWQPGLLPGFLELLSDRRQMPTAGSLGGKDPSLLLLRVWRQKCLANTRTEWHKSPSLGRFALVDEISLVAPVQVLPTHSENFLLVAHPRIAHDHQHIAKRLFAESQKFGFYMGVDDALPRVLLQ